MCIRDRRRVHGGTKIDEDLDIFSRKELRTRDRAKSSMTYGRFEDLLEESFYTMKALYSITNERALNRYDAELPKDYEIRSEKSDLVLLIPNVNPASLFRADIDDQTFVRLLRSQNEIKVTDTFRGIKPDDLWNLPSTDNEYAILIVDVKFLSYNGEDLFHSSKGRVTVAQNDIAYRRIRPSFLLRVQIQQLGVH
eukprot:TRINITY_DN10487_c0_g1_i1.p1 TRINITY_DN10487_c0_g1~~TRINITY_DN10487_c0_g1_i1.p1  ORF type:complete len:227 (+),score=38.97 TRINITY_DN10487_c0_g1_i1:99-683(+)